MRVEGETRASWEMEVGRRREDGGKEEGGGIRRKLSSQALRSTLHCAHLAAVTDVTRGQKAGKHLSDAVMMLQLFFFILATLH